MLGWVGGGGGSQGGRAGAWETREKEGRGEHRDGPSCLLCARLLSPTRINKHCRRTYSAGAGARGGGDCLPPTRVPLPTPPLPKSHSQKIQTGLGAIISKQQASLMI